jgi:hypothetical protein
LRTAGGAFSELLPEARVAGNDTIGRDDIVARLAAVGGCFEP